MIVDNCETCNNKNSTLIEKVYKDCEGNCFSIFLKEEPIYIQKNEILAPVFDSTTWGSYPFYNSKITKSAKKLKGKTIIHILRNLKVGSIVKLRHYPLIKYYLSKKLGKNTLGNFIFEIKRVDKHSIIYIDLKELEENRVLVINGYFKEKK